jgi:hypothetical protein
MAEHSCIQEHKLGDIESKVNRMDKELFNGDNSIIKTMPKLTQEVGKLSDNIESLRTAISGFQKFQNETVGKKDFIRSAIPWIAVIIAACSFVFSNAKIKNSQEYIDWKMGFKQDRIPDSTTRGGYVHYENLKDTL